MKRLPHVLLQKILARGGVGVLPTDTLYGIVGSALSKKAIARIYKVRRRNAKKPLIILIHALADVGLFGIALSPADKKILRTLWPGKVSVIVPCKGKKFAYLHRGTHTLAFRVPADAALRRLLSKTGPLVAPSANWEGHPPAKTVAGAKKYFGDDVDPVRSSPPKPFGRASAGATSNGVDFYIDHGRLVSPPSTIVTLKNGHISVVRKGAFKLSGRVVR